MKYGSDGSQPVGNVLTSHQVSRCLARCPGHRHRRQRRIQTPPVRLGLPLPSWAQSGTRGGRRGSPGRYGHPQAIPPGHERMGGPAGRRIRVAPPAQWSVSRATGAGCVLSSTLVILVHYPSNGPLWYLFVTISSPKQDMTPDRIRAIRQAAGSHPGGGWKASRRRTAGIHQVRIGEHEAEGGRDQPAPRAGS